MNDPEDVLPLVARHPNDAELRRMSLELAIQASSPDTLSTRLVAKAMVFQLYLGEGQMITSEDLERIRENVRGMVDIPKYPVR